MNFLKWFITDTKSVENEKNAVWLSLSTCHFQLSTLKLIKK